MYEDASPAMDYYALSCILTRLAEIGDDSVKSDGEIRAIIGGLQNKSPTERMKFVEKMRSVIKGEKPENTEEAEWKEILSSLSFLSYEKECTRGMRE